MTTAMALSGLLLAGSASAADAAANLLPKTLAGIALGMSEADFHKARPAAERFEIFGEPEVKGDDPNPWYTEPLKGDPFFDLTSYTFIAHRLCAVSLSALGQGEPFRIKQAKVLQGAVRKWGSGFERLWQLPGSRGPKQAPAKQPALLWKLDSFRVLAKFSDDRKSPKGRGDLSLAVMDLRCLPANVKQEMFSTLVPASDAGAAAAFKILEAQVEPPLFE
ncbi:MAG: hypothetical protein WAM82_35880 [Thermoanaerobaculia bacterium]